MSKADVALYLQLTEFTFKRHQSEQGNISHVSSHKKIPRKKGFLCMYWCSNFCSIKKYFHIFSVETTKKRQAINKSLRQKCCGYGVFRILDHYEFCCEVYFFSSSCLIHWSDVSWVLLDVIMTRDWTLK